MDWQLIWQFFVVFMLLGISGRLFLLRRKVEEIYDFCQRLEVGVNPMSDMVGEGRMRVLDLEQFIAEFGFDPRQEAEDADNSAAVAEWDNAKN